MGGEGAPAACTHQQQGEDDKEDWERVHRDAEDQGLEDCR